VISVILVKKFIQAFQVTGSLWKLSLYLACYLSPFLESQVSRVWIFSMGRVGSPQKIYDVASDIILNGSTVPHSVHIAQR
jgi:hypothetical protein